MQTFLEVLKPILIGLIPSLPTFIVTFKFLIKDSKSFNNVEILRKELPKILESEIKLKDLVSNSQDFFNKAKEDFKSDFIHIKNEIKEDTTKLLDEVKSSVKELKASIYQEVKREVLKELQKLKEEEEDDQDVSDISEERQDQIPNS